MAKFELRKQARLLRQTGISIGTIAKRVGVSKSTVSVWCNDIELTFEQREFLIKNAGLAGLRGRFGGAETNKRKKLDSLEYCRKWAGKLLGKVSKRDLLIAGVALYWAEGSKKGPKAFNFVNSDPTMICFMYVWLIRIMGINKSEMMPRISINEIHRPRIEVVLKFWAKLLDLPTEQFGNPWYIKAKVSKVYDNYDTYHGILRLGVRNGTMLKYKVLALIELLPKKFLKYAEVAQVVRASHS